jgi:hypothetical protein
MTAGLFYMEALLEGNIAKFEWLGAFLLVPLAYPRLSGNCVRIPSSVK